MNTELKTKPAYIKFKVHMVRNIRTLKLSPVLRSCDYFTNEHARILLVNTRLSSLSVISIVLVLV
jgi:hypothetical protein